MSEMIPVGEVRYARVPNPPFHDATLLVECIGPVYDVDGNFRHTEWRVLQGSTGSGFWRPGDRGVFDPAQLSEAVRVNWHKIPSR